MNTNDEKPLIIEKAGTSNDDVNTDTNVNEEIKLQSNDEPQTSFNEINEHENVDCKDTEEVKVNGVHEEKPSTSQDEIENHKKEENHNGENITLENIRFERTVDNRVKLYVLCEQKAWEDKGTGHVSCVSLPKSPGEWYLIVRLEDEDKNILESKILETTKYNRQQGTLIVWNESETVDLALSFQEKHGCEEVFQEILKVQSPDGTKIHYMDEENDSDSSESVVSNFSSSFTLPPCEITRINEIENIISSSLSSQSSREVIASALCRSDYLDQLCDTFQRVEDIDDENALSTMASISKDMFLLNNSQLLIEMINEKRFKHFVGMLEYDPAVKQCKKHREFLFEKAKFKEVLPLSNQELKNKITETFRLQYVQDVCLPAPSMFEENLLTTISGSIFFNRIDIVSQLMKEKDTLKQLFSELKQRDISPERQKDLACFLKEFCTFAQSLQPNGQQQGRESFFNMLMQNDVFQILDPCMSSSVPVTQSMTVELLGMIVDFALRTFREFLMNQEVQEDELLINKMFHYMMYDRDPEFSNARNMAEVMRVLLDPESPPSSECDEFLTFFYSKAMPLVVRPIKDLTCNGKISRDDYYTSRQMCMILTILIFCVKNHESHMKTYVIQNDLLNTILVLLKSKHHLLCLKALRLVRRIIETKDELYCRYVRDKNIFKPIVTAFLSNGDRYNLLNSAFLDLFEFMHLNNATILIDYIGKEFMDELEKITYVKTFVYFKRKYENRRELEIQKNEQMVVTTPIKKLPDNLQDQFDKEKRYDEEESLFDEDEVEHENGIYEENNEPVQIGTKRPFPVTPIRKSGSEPNFPSVPKRKRNGEDDGVASIFGGSASVPNIAKSTKITIKMPSFNSESDQNHSPPQNEQPIQDAVTKTILLKKSSLVNYDDSDSDGENDNNL